MDSMIRILVLSLTLLFLALPARAQNFNFESFTLDNGLTVVVIPNHRMPIAAHMVWYKVGAIDEVGGKSGLAHFLEHLMFKGTDAVPSGEFSKRVAEIGGTENAFTSTDYTAYHQIFAKEHLPLMMQLESDRMQNLQLRESDFNSEKKVIIEERNSRIDNNPGGVLQEEMMAALFRNHPYGRPLIGWLHEIQALTHADIMEFYKAHYAPNNAIVVIAGDVTLAEVQELAQKYYGALKPFAMQRAAAPKEPAQRAMRSVTYRDPKVQQAYYLRYAAMPSYYNAADRKIVYSLQVLAEILGGNRSSRLYKQLVLKDKIAASTGSSYQSDKLGPAVFAVSAVPKDGKQSAIIEKKIEDVIQDLAVNPVSDAELARIKNALVSEVIYAQDSIFRMAYLVGETLSLGGNLSDIEDWDDHIEAVTAKDIQDAATLVADRTGVATGWLLPPEPAAQRSAP